MKTILYKEYRPEGKRILIEALEPAALSSIRVILEALSTDGRFASLGLILSDYLRGVLQKELSDFTGIGTACKADVAVELMNPPAHEHPVLFENAKSRFGVAKVIYVTSGLASVVTFDEEARALLDLDYVVVNDELCKELYQLRMPWLEHGRFVPLGTPLIDEILTEDGASLRKSGREKLDVTDAEIVLFFSAFPSSDYSQFGASKTICVDALRETLQGIEAAAVREPNRHFVLLVRPHPRASKEEEDILLEVSKSKLPNVRVMVDSSLSYLESIYASDLVVCMATSTLSNLSRYRGQEALVMAYRDSDCGKVFDTLFPEPQAEVLASVDSVIVARDTEDIVEALQTVIKLAPERIEGSSIKRLMDLLA